MMFEQVRVSKSGTQETLIDGDGVLSEESFKREG